MLIRVMYNDGRYDLVKPFILDLLLAEGKIQGFRRSSGWVQIGRDPIRGAGGQSGRVYLGRERRRRPSPERMLA